MDVRMTGVLNLVSVGPGFSDLIVPRAVAALRDSEVVVAYELYLRWIEPWLAGKEIHTPPLTQERERARLAIERARAGARVALISSGDIGVYAMAALAFEEMREDDTYAVNVVPGITSANACASLLGSPLSHDFATLSLSDLLCPWEWIEQRARHIAQADLACVLYNVQSAGRQQGVYRILKLMLADKRAHTLCGVVRNAYRPGQQVDIYRLDELPALQFDMLTSIVIGNRFTERRRGYIFTPRGYNDWSAEAQAGGAVAGDAGEARDAAAQLAVAATAGTAAPERDAAPAATGSGAAPLGAAAPAAHTLDAAAASTAIAAVPSRAVPHGALWVFSGTSDGNALAERLAQRGHAVVVSCATEYGGALVQQDYPQLHVWDGPRGQEARRQALRASGARALVDATHPYAAVISPQLMALARELGMPYLRYERPSTLDAAGARIALCANVEVAALRAIASASRIFLATGSKDLATFLQAPGASAKSWFVRVTAEPDFIQRALDLGVPRQRICAMQGPFSQAFNTALWQDWGIDCVVTKDSGAPGGFAAKAAAAAALNLPLLVIERPRLDYPAQADSFDAVLAHLDRAVPA
jgi:precorrin-3B C17-methyltransferase